MKLIKLKGGFVPFSLLKVSISRFVQELLWLLLTLMSNDIAKLIIGDFIPFNLYSKSKDFMKK